MKLPNGANLQDYGVGPGHAYGVLLPSDGGSTVIQAPLNREEWLVLPISPEKWQEIERDGLAFIDLVCLGHSRVSHTERIALYHIQSGLHG